MVRNFVRIDLGDRPVRVNVIGGMIGT